MPKKENIYRILNSYACNKEWMARQMVMIAGPRQVGKTYFAKKILEKRLCAQFYYNFDNPTISTKFNENQAFFESKLRLWPKNNQGKRPIIAIDEIHKRRQWKNELKYIFDEHHNYTDIIVTGSARLDILTKSGESLAGRYLLFRMGPVGVRELENLNTTTPFENRFSILPELADSPVYSESHDQLLKLGGFPDPLQVGTIEYRNRWATDYRRLIIREDLRDLSKITEIESVEKLWPLLPEKVMSPLSIESLRKSLNSSHEATKNWLFNLEKLYSIFFVAPWSEKISRSIKKERKLYLMDWALHKDPARRFENFVISSLNRACQTWTDMGIGEFELRYIRNRDAKEADFLLIKDNLPFLIGDIKLSERPLDKHILQMAKSLNNIPAVQVIAQKGVLRFQNKNALLISSNQFLARFP